MRSSEPEVLKNQGEHKQAAATRGGETTEQAQDEGKKIGK